jgi:hypothetical protein
MIDKLEDYRAVEVINSMLFDVVLALVHQHFNDELKISSTELERLTLGKRLEFYADDGVLTFKVTYAHSS